MADSINLKLGGDSQDFVTSCTAAVNAERTLIEYTKKGKKAFEDQAKSTDKASDSQKKHGRSTKGATTEVGALGRMLRTQMSAVQGFIGAWVGIEGIKKAWRLVKEEIQAVIDAQKKLAQGSRALEDSAKAVMNQTGWTYKKSQARVLEIMTRGRFEGPQQAREVINKANAAFAKLGPENQDAMANVIADFVGRRQLGTAESGLLIEMLKKFGAKDVTSAKAQMAKIWAGSKSSMAEFSPYVMGLSAGAPELKERGATPEMLLAMMTRGREVKSTTMQTGELMKQMGMALGRPDVRKALAKRGGMREEGFLGLSYDEQIMRFGNWVAEMGKTPKGIMKMGEILPPEMVGRVGAMFSPEGMKSMMGYKAEFGGVGAEAWDKGKTEYDPNLRRLEEVRTTAAKGKLLASQQLKMGAALVSTGESLMTRIRAGEDVPELTQEEQDTLRRAYIHMNKDKAAQLTAQYLLKARARALEQKAMATGVLQRGITGGPGPGGPVSYAPSRPTWTGQGEFGVGTAEMLENLRRAKPGFLQTDPKEFGVVEEQITALENMAENMKSVDDNTKQGAKSPHAVE